MPGGHRAWGSFGSGSGTGHEASSSAGQPPQGSDNGGQIRMVASLATEKDVPFGDLAQQHAELRGELLEACDRVVSNSGFVLGEEVDDFEREFAAYCGVEHCVGVGSGTAALTLSLIAAGIGE